MIIAVLVATMKEAVVLIRILSALLFVLTLSKCESGTSIFGDASLDAPYDTSSLDSESSWELPIDNLSEPGWRDSTEPLCRDDSRTRNSLDVWSDPRGVFVIVQIQSSGIQNYLYYNDGSGWQDILTEELLSGEPYESIDHITGVLGGLLFGWTDLGSYSTIDLINSTIDRRYIGVSDIFVVSNNLAYAVLSDDPRLIFFDGASWGPFPGEATPFKMKVVWASETSLYCGGNTGVVINYIEPGWTIHDTGTTSSITAIWGESDIDVWVGTASGEILRYNGVEWIDTNWPDSSDSSTACRTKSAISGIWGSSDNIFFSTDTQFAVWDESSFRVLGYWPGEYFEVDGSGYCEGRLRINAMWGNSSEEVFLAVSEENSDASHCNEYLIWWDGRDFHWF